VPLASDPSLGEIQVRAPGLRAHYFKNPEQDAEWLATGDIGRLDDQGRLQLLGRLHERIICGGMNVYPLPLEQVLLSHPEVADAAVVGVEDPFLGEEVVAWVVPRSDAGLDDEQLREHLHRQVESRRAPTRFLFAPSLPRGEGGKLQRRTLSEQALALKQQCRETDFARRLKHVSAARRLALLKAAIKDCLSALIADPSWSGRDCTMAEMGLDSMGAVMLANRLSDKLGRPLPGTLAFESPTVEALARNLCERLEATAPRSPALRPSHGGSEIAIVGAACRLPGITEVSQFWDLLLQAGSTTREIARWSMDRLYDPQPGKRGRCYTRRASLLELGTFDAPFFEMNAKEAEALDPQHGIALEVAWQALEQGGFAPRSSGAACGVFLGLSGTHWGGSDPLGRLPSMAAGRIAHLLDLHGPVLALDTACSSGLVAVHTAIQSLRSGQCDLALAGAANLIPSPDSFVALSQIRALSPDGLCKAFDAAADGFGRGEGCVMLVLQPLARAVQEGRPVLAVIRGSAVNHDGRASSLTAPNGMAQRAVAWAALQDAGVAPGEIAYLEAHGSGTALGDPIEVEAAMAVYGQRREPLLIGSVKSNLGHLEAAAGAVGLLKAALVVNRRQVPPHLHFHTLHPGLASFAPRLRIPTRTVPLPEGQPLRAAVTSLGMGGTNAALIVESPPPLPAPEPADEPALLCLSARNHQALQALQESYRDYLAGNPVRAVDAGYTSAVGREHFRHRLAVSGDSSQRLAGLLAQATPIEPAGEPRLAFLFTGQGSLYPGAGCRLAESEPVFRESLQRCARILGQELGSSDRLRQALQSAEPDVAQPALFSLEWALSQLWISWGLLPEWLLGHSLGEYVAACLAGVFSLEDALGLVTARGRLMAGVGGAMVSVAAGVEQVGNLLGSRPLDIAAINGPSATVLAGPRSEVEDWAAELAGAGISARILPVGTAFHSRLLEPILADFQKQLAGTRRHAPRIEIVSTVTGHILSAEQATSVDHWMRGIRQTVLFHDAVSELERQGASVFLEIGPHPVLCGLGAGRARNARWIPSLRRSEPERESLLSSLGTLYEAGLNPDWQAVYSATSGRPVHLPTYPFGIPERPRIAREKEPARPSLEQIVAGLLAVEPEALKAEESLLDQGLTSLRLLQLLVLLEQRFGRRFSPNQVLQANSLAGLRALLSSPASESEEASPLVRLGAGQESPHAVPLVCFHPAGGQIAAYLPLRSLPGPVHAIASRGCGDASLEAPSLAAMVEDYAALLLQAFPRGPLALLGWSFGALLAHQVARQLESAGREVAGVTMIDPPRAGLKMDQALCLQALLHTYSSRPPGITELRKKVKKKSDEELWELSLGEGWLDAESLDLPGFLSHLALHRRHVAMVKELVGSAIAAPIDLWWAKMPTDPESWSELSSAEVRQATLGGDHYTIVRGHRLEKILERLRLAWLREQSPE
jgi:acyl transferase domain-containing protein